MKKAFYPIIYSTVAVGLVIAFALSVYNAGNVPRQEEMAVEESTGGAAAVAKSDVKSYREQTTAATTEALKSEPATEITTAAAKTASVAEAEPKYTLFDDSQELLWPVEGRIVMDYSVATAVYDKSLDQYRTNDSLCIAAPADTQVRACADGVVEAVSKDKVSGNRVVINHGNGWKTTYSQLREDVSATQGQVVCAGEVIGRVGTPTAYSSELGTHLALTLTKENMPVDPKSLLVAQD